MDRIAVVKSENVSRECCLSLLFIHTQRALKFQILKSYSTTEAHFQMQSTTDTFPLIFMLHFLKGHCVMF